MKIKKISSFPYQLPCKTVKDLKGFLICLKSEKGNEGWGNIAPLPNFSTESLDEAYLQFLQRKQALSSIDWQIETLIEQLSPFKLLPSVLFGIESALFSLLDPLEEHSIKTSALLMGSFDEIQDEGHLRIQEGYTSAKIKVSQLSFKQAEELIYMFKDLFKLRIDVNRAWDIETANHFFSQFPLDAFDYVEEPCKNPLDLKYFTHPLAVDESFPSSLSLNDLEKLPALKAVIYKPTIQGGLLNCLPLKTWADQHKIDLVLSSSFESDLGLANIASMAHRLNLRAPIGIGTYHYIKTPLLTPLLSFSRSFIQIPKEVSYGMRRSLH